MRHGRLCVRTQTSLTKSRWKKTSRSSNDHPICRSSLRLGGRIQHELRLHLCQCDKTVQVCFQLRCGESILLGGVRCNRIESRFFEEPRHAMRYSFEKAISQFQCFGVNSSRFITLPYISRSGLIQHLVAFCSIGQSVDEQGAFGSLPKQGLPTGLPVFSY